MPIFLILSTAMREPVPTVGIIQLVFRNPIYTENYVYCNGTPLRLTDSDIGSENYTTSDYYVWNAETRSSQLLFIFPKKST